MERLAKGNLKIRKKILLGDEFHSPDSKEGYAINQLRSIEGFNSRVKAGEIGFECVSCLCGGSEFDLFATVDRYGLLQDTVMCVKCGLIQSNPRMQEREYRDFYLSDTYRFCYEGKDFTVNSLFRYEPGYAKHIFSEVNGIRKIQPGVRVLEIGAAGGWNLVPFLKAGAEVLGVEYSASLTQLGLSQGIPMQQGDGMDVTGQFDVIIINHVMEHFLAPVISLQKIAQHLEENGIIYIAVPNISRFDISQIQNAHTYYFTSQTFGYYCAQAGLQLLKFGKAEKIHMFGIFSRSVDQPKPELRKSPVNFTWFKLKKKLKKILKGIQILSNA